MRSDSVFRTFVGVALFASTIMITPNCKSDEIDFRYNVIGELVRSPIFELIRFTKKFQEAGYWPVDIQNIGANKFFFMDQIYVDHLWNRAIFLKFGLQPSVSSAFRRFIKLENGYVYHDVIDGKIPYAVYFYNHSLYEAKKAIEANSYVSQQMKVNPLSFLVSQAYAETGNVCLTSVGIRNDTPGAVSVLAAEASALQTLSSCAISAFRESSGVVSGTIESFKEFLTSPKRLWERTEKVFNEFRDFMRSIRSEVRTLFQSIGSLDLDLMGQVGCVLAGHLAPSIAASLVGGGGLAKLLPSLSSSMLAINGIKKLIAVAANLKKAGQRALDVSSVVHKALNGKISSEIRNLSEKLSDRFPQAALGVMSCETN